MKIPRFGKLGSDQRQEVLATVKEQAQTDHGYYLMIVLSIVIAVLGLMLNSAAVIIGGMIVSPLLYPLISIGAAIATGDSSLLQKSLWIAAKSITLTLVAAIGISYISPIKEPTMEILARTEPTLIDLIVAIASGLAGAYAVVEKERLTSIMGVAVAAALIPPLGIVGYSIAAGSADLFVGSSLLFLANFIAIILSTVVIFYLTGFRPAHAGKEREVAMKGFLTSVIVFVFVLFILTGFLVTTISTARRQSNIERTVTNYLRSYNDTTLISIDENNDPDESNVTVVVQSPSSFTQRAINLLDTELEERLGKEVSLQLLVIPVTRLQDE